MTTAGVAPDSSAEGQGQPSIFSIGHSTRPLSELVEVLQGAGVKTLVDVRTVPKSRWRLSRHRWRAAPPAGASPATARLPPPLLQLPCFPCSLS